ncbi:metallophosphoesterase [Dawidia soli]|nr:metallophosphoesterase [Dawidia soli]
MTMKIQYCSDLHLEFPANKNYLSKHPLEPVGDILLLAGDIVLFTHIETEKTFFDYLSDNFRHVYWLPGNHEYYRSDFNRRTGTFQENIRSNVTLLNNTTIVTRDTRLVFSTLWSQINPAKEHAIKRVMSDFKLITVNGRKINIDEYNALHADALRYLQTELTTPATQRTIVITHHRPTFLNYPERYRHSELNTAFATELYNLIEISGASHWIFAHTHETPSEITIGETILTTNPLGYIERNEHHSFKTRVI